MGTNRPLSVSGRHSSPPPGGISPPQYSTQRGIQIPGFDPTRYGLYEKFPTLEKPAMSAPTRNSPIKGSMPHGTKRNARVHQTATSQGIIPSPVPGCSGFQGPSFSSNLTNASPSAQLLAQSPRPEFGPRHYQTSGNSFTQSPPPAATPRKVATKPSLSQKSPLQAIMSTQTEQDIASGQPFSKPSTCTPVAGGHVGAPSINNLLSLAPVRSGRPEQPTHLTSARQRETPQEHLKRVQAEAMREIGHNRRHKGQAPETTSLRDLHLARKPLPAHLALKVASKVESIRTSVLTPIHPHPPVRTSILDRDDTPSQVTISAHSRVNNESSLMLATPKITPAPKSRHASKSQHTLASVETGYYIPDHAKDATPVRNPRWATKEEIRPEEVSDDSNAWGSVGSEAEAGTDDSIEAMHHGKLFKTKPPIVPESPLVGWDGKIQPPPVDWNERPRFYNNTPDFKNMFHDWRQATSGLISPASPDLPFTTIADAKVLNPSCHADGLDMVPLTLTVNLSNARYYGYHPDIKEVINEVAPLTIEDLAQDVQLDENNPLNHTILQETTELVVQKWLVQQELLHRKKATTPAAAQSVVTQNESQQVEECMPLPNPNRPKINIYVRPAVKSDIPQMTSIYNWHIENGPKTAEWVAITDIEMRCRFENVISTKLPFIVAVERSKNQATYYGHDDVAEVATTKHNDHPGKKNNKSYRGVVRQEKILGWACAQDFTAPDFVEHISAELEIYVAHEFRQQGIGRCLMDKLIESTDRGYSKRGGFPFHCAREVAHLYNTGGGRDLHKQLFVVRTWKFPKPQGLVAEKVKAGKSKVIAKACATTGEMADDRDDEYNAWLKQWIESWGFEVEGVLKGVGMKNGRFLNVAYFGRETMWQPQEGKIPAPLPGTVCAA